MDKKIFVVAKREYLERIRSKFFLVVTLVVPVLLSGVVIFPAYLASRGKASHDIQHIAIIDGSGAGLGDRIAKALMGDTLAAASDSIQPRVVTVTPAQIPAEEAKATAEVEKPRHIAGYLVLTDSTLTTQTARYAGRNASAITDMDKLESVVRQEVMMVRLEREGVRQDIVGDLARAKFRLSSERLSDKGRAGSGEGGLFAGILVGVMLFMSIILHGQNILRGVLEEKSTRVAEVVISSVKPETLLAGKILGVGAVGLTQQVAWFGIASYLITFFMPIMLKGAAVPAAGGAGAGVLSGAMGGISPALIAISLAYFVVGFVFYATLYAAAGSMVNSEQEAQQAQIPVMLLIMSAWVMVTPVMSAPNGTLAVVLSWLPWSSPIIMPMRIGLTSVSPVAIAGSLVVAVLGSIGAVWLSARIYRVGMLMYGKKPSFAEVVKWIRYA
ncbi:MAG TPA: ABC transporter permease [Gemmatimonadaceae bacterium]|jgi:ABC-2 type transport system permease protein